VAAAVLALAFGLASSRALDGANAAPAATPSAAAPGFAKRLLLRLHDLPLGYRLLDFGSPTQPFSLFGCDALHPSNPQPRLASFLKRYSPSGCMVVYHRLFRLSGEVRAPRLVGSAAAELGSVKAAEEGLAVSRELLTHLTEGEPPEELPPPQTIGEETRLFHWTQEGGDRRGVFAGGETISIVVWRWGSSVGLVLVSGGLSAPNDPAAFEIALHQQRHLEAPTPYRPSEYDDTEVALEAPALEVPVYWLGRSFASGQSLPRLRLGDTTSTGYPSIRFPRVNLFYTAPPRSGRGEAVELDLWLPRHWRARRAKAPLPFEMHCRKTRRLDLPRGRMVVYAGLHPGLRCGQAGRKVHAAVIHFPGVVITAETLSFCEVCFGAGTGPYNSFKGMAAIARGLERRFQPASR
jgi:hypothetical protein